MEPAICLWGGASIGFYAPLSLLFYRSPAMHCEWHYYTSHALWLIRNHNRCCCSILCMLPCGLVSQFWLPHAPKFGILENFFPPLPVPSIPLFVSLILFSFFTLPMSILLFLLKFLSKSCNVTILFFGWPSISLPESKNASNVTLASNASPNVRSNTGTECRIQMF